MITYQGFLFCCIFDSTMKKIKLLFVGLLLGLNSLSQELVIYVQNDLNFSVITRWKILGMQFLEDILHFNTTVGLEFRFLNYHSVGVDYVYMRHRNEEESYDILKDQYYDNGFSDFDLREYMLVDYRFYFNFRPKAKSTFLPYVSLFTKIGESKKWYQYKSIFTRNSSYNFRAKFRDYGIGFGSHLGFLPEGRAGADINIGLVRRFSILNYNSSLEEQPFKTSSWHPHMRVNLYFNLFKIRIELL